jgi:hypothetical protein
MQGAGAGYGRVVIVTLEDLTAKVPPPAPSPNRGKWGCR